MTEINNSEHIQKLVEQYERKRIYEKERYQMIKDTDEFKTKNRNRAATHYSINKDKRKDRYDNDIEFMRAKSQYYYYKKTDQLDIFKEKYPNKFELLIQRNLIIKV
tara:strand:+ start:592 stop:909 length:318 start_codon:yes stop_codon:yes gene_type:complete